MSREEGEEEMGEKQKEERNKRHDRERLITEKRGEDSECRKFR